MENPPVQPIADGKITSIHFSLATHDEICTSSISDCPISHPSQLANPFLGLPLETGKCESCGTAEPGKCDGHFGYIQLPVPVYHPCHLSELKKLLDLVCLKCLRMKKTRLNGGNDKSSNAPCSYCPDIPQLFLNEVETTDGVVFLELKPHHKFSIWDGFWNFLDRYGYQYSEERQRPLLPSEVLEVLKRFPEDTRNKLAGKGYFPQEGYILQELPVPPNGLSVPDISDGTSIMSSDISGSMLKKVLKQSGIIKSSRSGLPNFESHKVEANDLQLAIAQYLHVRGTAKAFHGINARFGVSSEAATSNTKAWAEKMKTLFISKGSGFSSRSVITGDAYRNVNEVGLPLEIAQMVTFEEKVTEHNRNFLQKLVDHKLCLTYKDGVSMYSLTEGSKGHTSLRVGQVVHRRVMDGDIVFINRQPSTHKHSLQALSIYVHEDHTVKINPLICAPLGADFDGDCIHLFYPQSLAAKAEVLELFSVEQQMLSSHTGALNLQFANDALLSLKLLFKKFMLDQPIAQQLAMFVSSSLPHPFLLKANSSGSQWTVLQILQTALPVCFDCLGETYLIRQGEMLKADCNRDMLQSLFNEIISSVFFENGPKEALHIFNSLQPMLMEHLFLEGYSISLEEFYVPKSVSEDLLQNIQNLSPLLYRSRKTCNELLEMQIENYLKMEKLPIINFICACSSLGNLLDLRSDSSMDRVVQQIGFLGTQLANRGKFYSRTLVEDTTSVILRKYAIDEDGDRYPSEAFGVIKSCFIQGLNPYENLVHSTSSREVIIRSSRGLTEPGTLFKNLMAILRDVTISYDGTVRNVCTNSLVQFEYGVEAGRSIQNFYPAGEPVGVLAATSISNISYKAVLDSSASSNSSWELMKEILQCGVKFRNELNDHRVILYLNDCGCGKKYCKENAAYLVKNQMKRVCLKDIAVNFLIGHQKEQISTNSVSNSSLVGHIHLDQKRLKGMNRSMHEVLFNCQENIVSLRKKKKSNLGEHLKKIILSVSECCTFEQSSDSEWSQNPCLQFSSADTGFEFEKTSQFMANIVCPVLLETIIKGDRRVDTANIIWIGPHMPTWVRNHRGTENSELALEIVLQKGVVKNTGDAWRIVLDSCLPVIDSIDLRRSIPYSIKQVEELLGISCAFDQAVQRLSKSISKVAKGVLTEHLTLVANSMTCTGNLIGFNKGGYKALFHSLNVQVPFTEATLYTPRQCFEKAAEKRQKDSLSSIVASCSWGKQVAVGTGAKFEILWNKKEMGSNKDGVIDVYNFLQLVRNSANGERFNTACLGKEIDDLELEDGDMELTFSPEHGAGYGKPIFEDDTEHAVTGSAWGSWDTDMNMKELQASHSTKPSEDFQGAGWGDTKESDKPPPSLVNPEKESDTSIWATTDKKSQWGQQNRDDTEFKKPSSISWGTPVKQSDEMSQWGQQNREDTESKKPFSNSWGTPVQQSDETSGWGQQNRDDTESKKPSPNSWGTQVKHSDEKSQWESRNRDAMDTKKPSFNFWGTPTKTSSGSTENDQWGQETECHANRSTRPSEELSAAGARAWGSPNTGDWKLKKNYPVKSQGKPGDWKPSGVPAAANKQQFNQYTAEEQTILAEVEPIMRSMRRIMHQTGNDERLSDDDQAYVLEKVFNYHPDKETKMGRGIDYVTVSEHSRFQGSRCFYIVSADGQREDFSYPKCMMNFVEQKYPEIGTSFNGKYFNRKRQPSFGGRQEEGRSREARFRGGQGQRWSGRRDTGSSQEQGRSRAQGSQEHGGLGEPSSRGSQQQGWSEEARSQGWSGASKW